MGIQSGSADTLKNIYKRPTPLEKIVEGIELFSKYKVRTEYHYIVNNPFESDRNRIETLHFAARHHRGPSILRIFPLQFYPGTPLYDQAREAGLIGQRHESAYEFTYTGSTHLHDSQYLDIWLRVVLNLRNWRVPSWPLHRLIDVVTHPLARKLMDRPWFVPTAYGAYRVGRFVGRKLLYQTLIRPFKYLRRKSRYEELHPEDEVTLPRRQVPPEPTGHRRRTRKRSATPAPAVRWSVPKVNLHAKHRLRLAKKL